MCVEDRSSSTDTWPLITISLCKKIPVLCNVRNLLNNWQHIEQKFNHLNGIWCPSEIQFSLLFCDGSYLCHKSLTLLTHVFLKSGNHIDVFALYIVSVAWITIINGRHIKPHKDKYKQIKNNYNYKNSCMLSRLDLDLKNLKFLNFCCKVCPMRWNLVGIVATNKSAVPEHGNWTVPIITPLQTNQPPQFPQSACSLSQCSCHYLAVLMPGKPLSFACWHSSSNLNVFTMPFTSTMHWCQLHHNIESCYTTVWQMW